jgi:hypothetical protein
MYYSGIKEPDPLISRIKKAYAADIIQLEPMWPIEQLVQNQYPFKIPTFRLKQPIIIASGVPIQQTMVATLPINIPITTRLLVYGNNVLI